MGPLFEPTNEEIFLSSSHGVASWTVAVIATAMMIAISGLSLAGPSMNAAAILGASANTTPQSRSSDNAGAYWVDTLLRPTARNVANAAAVAPGTTASTAPATASAIPARPVDPELRTEAARILTYGLAGGGTLSMADHDRLTAIVSQVAGVESAEADRRVDDVQIRIRDTAAAAAETARKAARSLSLWLAASLFLGGFAAAAGAVTGRHVDDTARGFGLRK